MTGAATRELAAAVDVARCRVGPRVRATPVLEATPFDAAVGGRVLVKTECLQLTGSFKYRGALNAVARLVDDPEVRRVVAASSGNHAGALAEAARCHGLASTVVIPIDAPDGKVARCRRAGSRVVRYRVGVDDRDAIARAEASDTGSVILPSSDHLDVMAGQGTVGVELFVDAASRGVVLDVVLVPCGGGGLAAGIAAAASELSPTTEVIPVEPAGYDDVARSLDAGTSVAVSPVERTICGGLEHRRPAERPLAVLLESCRRGFVVDDDAVVDAMRSAFDHLNLVIEPSGAVALAALDAYRNELAGASIGVVLSGGNIDVATFARLVDGRGGPPP